MFVEHGAYLLRWPAGKRRRLCSLWRPRGDVLGALRVCHHIRSRNMGQRHTRCHLPPSSRNAPRPQRIHPQLGSGRLVGDSDQCALHVHCLYGWLMALRRHRLQAQRMCQGCFCRSFRVHTDGAECGALLRHNSHVTATVAQAQGGVGAGFRVGAGYCDGSPFPRVGVTSGAQHHVLRDTPHRSVPSIPWGACRAAGAGSIRGVLRAASGCCSSVLLADGCASAARTAWWGTATEGARPKAKSSAHFSGFRRSLLRVLPAAARIPPLVSLAPHSFRRLRRHVAWHSHRRFLPQFRQFLRQPCGPVLCQRHIQEAFQQTSSLLVSQESIRSRGQGRLHIYSSSCWTFCQDHGLQPRVEYSLYSIWNVLTMV